MYGGLNVCYLKFEFYQIKRRACFGTLGADMQHWPVQRRATTAASLANGCTPQSDILAQPTKDDINAIPLFHDLPHGSLHLFGLRDVRDESYRLAALPLDLGNSL